MAFFLQLARRLAFSDPLFLTIAFSFLFKAGASTRLFASIVPRGLPFPRSFHFTAGAFVGSIFPRSFLSLLC